MIWLTVNLKQRNDDDEFGAISWLKFKHKDGSIEEAKLNAAYAGGAELSYRNNSKMMNIHNDRYG